MRSSLTFLLSSCIYIGAHINAECPVKVDSIETQRDFKLEKWLGKWFEIKWIPESYIPVGARYVDYSHTYSRKNTSQVEAHTRASVNKTSVKCTLSYRNTLHTNAAVPAKMMYERRYNKTAFIKADYWVIITDYNTYALAYGCRDRNSDGTCSAQAVDCWVWSRRQTLNATSMRKIDDVIQNKLCLNLTNFITTDQSRDCTSSHGHNLGYSLSGLLFAFSITIFFKS